MKLSKCTHGVLVITNSDKNNREIGMVVGITYNCHLLHCGGMSPDELIERTVPLVQFPKGTRGIHHGNIELYKG